jgi:hypothetical protein
VICLHRYELIIETGKKQITTDEEIELANAVNALVVSLNFEVVSFKAMVERQDGR